MNAVKVFDLNMGKLPTKIPLLSLPATVLMPSGKLSVRLIDPKQMMMVFWALANGRMIGIVQKQEHGKNIYSVGCAGRISGFLENEDGCLILYLTGVCRFKVLECFKDTYDMIEVSYQPFKADFQEMKALFNPSAVLFALDVYVKLKHLDIDSQLFKSLPPQKLIATLVSLLPLEPSEKQALMEKEDLNECAATLLTILKMDTISEQGKGSGSC